MRSGNLCPLGSGPGDHEIPQLHQSHRACWRASRWTAAIRTAAEHEPCCAASASGSAATASARKFFTQSAPVHFARTLDQMLAFLAGAHSGTERQAGSGEDRGILRRQSRNAASGGLHRRASVARKLCRHDLLGRARISRDEFERRDAVHQVQGHAGRRRRPGRPRTRPRRSPPTSCTATSTPGSRPAISGSA